MDTKDIKKRLESGFLGFWVKKRRTTFLVMAAIIALGIFSAYTIPKESNPDIDFGIISITTIYQGVNPQDMDNLVTEKIEQDIKDIDGIKKITSNSSVGVSSVVIEFDNDADMTQALVDMKDAVDKVDLPSDAEDPMVMEISSNNELMFSVLLYAPADKYDTMYLKEKARKIKANLDGKGNINRIDFDASIDMDLGQSVGGGDSYFDIQISVDKNKTETIGLSLMQIAQTIRNWNKNQPLGNHEIGELSYDFRIEGELKNTEDLQMLPIKTSRGFIYLKDIASIQPKLINDTQQRMGKYQLSGQQYVSLLFNKAKGVNVFKASEEAKKMLDEELQKTEYNGLSYVTTFDLAELIQEDYNKLAKNGLQTLILVFVALLIFVGWKESIIATITLPLAFFVSFFVLKQSGLSLNFLTNFSFIITFGIAIDTTIVVIEGAHEKMRQGFKPKHAILLAVRDYSTPLIAGTATTVCVFIPMLTLPGIMGKFLAYIPITIFSTLIAALFISLTINSALYFKLSKPRKYFESDIGDPEFMKPEIKALLEEDRTHKTEKPIHESTKREKILDHISDRYSEKLEKIMENNKTRYWGITIPILLLFLSLIFISPNLGFKLFPENDNGFMNASLTAKKGTTTDQMEAHYDKLDDIFSNIPEMKSYYMSATNNKLNISIELTNPTERKKEKMKTVFDIEKLLEQEFDTFRAQGLNVQIKAQSDGPPSSKAIGIKLLADTNDKFQTLIEVAKDFEQHLNTVPGTKNVGISSEESPGQFVYILDKAKLAIMGITPSDLMFDLFATTNGINAGTLKGKFDNHDIEVSYQDYENGINPSDIDNISINTMAGPVRVGNISKNTFESSISSISREDTKITISIQADTEPGITPEKIQTNLKTFAQEYNYPDGISFTEGGENQENAELIQAMVVAFAVALILIAGILVLQFNSYTQPLIIMGSIFMGLLGANIGLFITGQPYSIMFGIGFIALTGIVVNDAIVFIDRVNKNLERGMTKNHALKEAGRARLQPIMLTTITTVVGLSSIAGDAMFKPLAITIMFGIFTGSATTLLVVPAMFHDKHKLIHLIKRFILMPLIFFIIPISIGFVAILILKIIFGINIGDMGVRIIIGSISLIYLIGYTIHYFKCMPIKGQTFLHKIFGIKVIKSEKTYLTKKLLLKRIGIQVGLLFIPIIVGNLLGLINKSIGTGVMVLGITSLIAYHIYILWLSKDYNTFSDKLAKAHVLDLKIEENK